MEDADSDAFFTEQCRQLRSGLVDVCEVCQVHRYVLTLLHTLLLFYSFRSIKYHKMQKLTCQM